MRPVLVIAPRGLGVLEDGVAERVAGLHPHLARQARHGLEVVREDVRAGVEDDVDGVGVPLEVAGQDLERQLRAAPLAPRGSSPPSARRRRRRRSSRSTQVMTVCRSPSSASIVATRSRLVGIGGQRPPGRHVAELTGAGADVAQDHDGQRLRGSSTRRCWGRTRSRRRCAAPARATRRLRSKKVSPGRHLHPDPVGLGREPLARPRVRQRLRPPGLRLTALGLEDAQLSGPGLDDALGHACARAIYSIARAMLRACRAIRSGRPCGRSAFANSPRPPAMRPNMTIVIQRLVGWK